MIVIHSRALVLAGALSFIAALLHLACIAFGAPWYRALGAGERMAHMASRGHWYPTVLTLFIAAVLTGWALYAWSGAGLVRRLPLLRTVLCAITAVYLVRAATFAPLKVYFPENSTAFWFWSSGVSLIIGIIHLIGLRRAWATL